MTVYPGNIDDDSTIQRVDDNITEIGELVINQIRAAIFALETTLGINPQGSLSSLADRIDVSINPNGTIKASALTAVGLVTLPIINADVAFNAAIEESKLDLAHTTTDLHTAILGLSALVSSLTTYATDTRTDLMLHITGAAHLSDGTTDARHVASHIDINITPTDPRDPGYTWTGLVDKDGNPRTATEAATAFFQINESLIDHENALLDAHPATAITVDTSNFIELPTDADNVQKALEAIDQSDVLLIGDHRANMHSNGVPNTSRSVTLNDDKKNITIVPNTPVEAYLVVSPSITPIDDNSNGDDIIKFIPDNTDFKFDSYFAKVKSGDIITIDYNNGITTTRIIDSVRHTPGVDWTIRINGTNLYDTVDGIARIDRPFFDTNVYGVLAAAQANNDIYPNIMGSIILGSPRGANALGIGFDPNQIDSTHYNLYLQLYPTGDPFEHVINMPAIDVSGNNGSTPGKYTLRSIVYNTNEKLRAAGFNYRFIAYSHRGEFGIMLADAINNASFSIVNGSASGAVLVPGPFPNNVIGDASSGKDALGLGRAKAGIASPRFVSGVHSSALEASTLYTNVISPLKRRNFIVNGAKRDVFDSTYMATNGYWDAEITSRTQIGTSTIEVTYTIDECLQSSELSIGKTIVVQPAVEYSDPTYRNTDYGRFIIKDVSFPFDCDSSSASTVITVVSGIHSTGNPISSSSEPTYPVRIYFGEDSIGFNESNVIDSVSPSEDYNRFHEIFIDLNGRTNAHERARLLRQNESITDLKTNSNWVFNDVSPKLKGVVDPSSAEFKRYVRFYVLKYDSISGEYDGYIGDPDFGTDGIINPGVVTRARKNTPARFYNASNVDFVELTFEELNASPGTSILSTDNPRYVDIELFDSLRLNQEQFFVASCDLVENVVVNIDDRREFGNVSEDNLSTSAKRYIEAGNRHLHANGVVRGLGYVGVDPLNSGRVLLDGGVAIVNGHVTAVNNGYVEIPQVYTEGGSLPEFIDWAICVNESGQFETIIITSLENQFFATNGTNAYYLPSVTFSELVSSRKDLTVLYIINVKIESITVDKYYDARRFVNSFDGNLPYTLVSDDLNGNFKNFNQLLTWLKYNSSKNSLVNVRGDVEVNDHVTFESIQSRVIIDGGGSGKLIFNDCSIYIRNNDSYTSNVEFINLNFEFKLNSFLSVEPSNITGDVTFRNCKLLFNNYNYSTFGMGISSNTKIYDCDFELAGSGSITDNQRLHMGGGLLFFYMENNVSNITISNSTFKYSEAGDYRHSFIHFEMYSDVVLDGVKITGCKFVDTPNVATLSKQTSVSIINAGGGNATVANVWISDNYSNLNQGIYIVGTSTSLLNAINCNVMNNQCGLIGYAVTTRDPSDYSGQNIDRNIYKPAGLKITGNTCTIIATCNLTGASNILEWTVDTGHVMISNNIVSHIQVAFVGYLEATPSGYGNISALTISDNMMTSLYGAGNNTDIDFTLFGSSAIFVTPSIAPYVIGNKFNTEIAVIENNNITASSIESTGDDNLYNSGIVTSSCSVIRNNVIRGFTEYGIIVNNTTHMAFRAFVEHNKIYRFGYGTSNIVNYISSSAINCIIRKNYFDHYTVDGASENVISISGTGSYASDNINQTVVSKAKIAGLFDIYKSFMVSSSRKYSLTGAGGNSNARMDKISNHVEFVYDHNDGATAIEFISVASLTKLIPSETKLVGLLINIESDRNHGGTLTNQFETELSGENVPDTTSHNLSMGTNSISKLYPDSIPWRSLPSNLLTLKFTMVDSAATLDILNYIMANEITIRYRW